MHPKSFPSSLLVCAALLFTVVTSTSIAQETEDKWVSIFNGKDLDGWTPKIRKYAVGENYGDTFRVEDGLLKVRYDKYENGFDGRFAHLFYKKPLSRYRLRIEYRFVGDQATSSPGWAFRNSGVMLHAQAPETMRKEQEFPVSLEAQFLGGDGKKDRTNANLCTPGTTVKFDGTQQEKHCTSSTSKTYHGDEWVTVEVDVNSSGPIKHIIDGETVLTYDSAELDENDKDAKKLIKNGDKTLNSGYIALQSESHPIDFRKVELLELTGNK